MPDTATNVTKHDFAKRLQAALQGAKKNGSAAVSAAPAARADEPEKSQG